MIEEGTAWERLRGLAKYLRSKREQGFFIFSSKHIDNHEMMKAFHDSHLDAISRMANLEEKAGNKYYRKNSHGKICTEKSKTTPRKRT